MPAHQGVGVLTFDMTPSDSILFNSCCTFFCSGNGILLGVNKQALHMASASFHGALPFLPILQCLILALQSPVMVLTCTTRPNFSTTGSSKRLFLKPFTTYICCISCLSLNWSIPLNYPDRYCMVCWTIEKFRRFCQLYFTLHLIKLL